MDDLIYWYLLKLIQKLKIVYFQKKYFSFDTYRCIWLRVDKIHVHRMERYNSPRLFTWQWVDEFCTFLNWQIVFYAYSTILKNYGNLWLFNLIGAGRVFSDPLRKILPPSPNFPRFFRNLSFLLKTVFSSQKRLFGPIYFFSREPRVLCITVPVLRSELREHV